MIYGNSISGKYDIFSAIVDNASNMVDYRAYPAEINNMNLEPEKCDRTLYYSTTYKKLIKPYSAEESFAYDVIMEREQMIERNFNDYVRRLGREKDPSASAAFVSAYIHGTPSISANGMLFGQPAGTDLSDWFRFKDICVIGLSGTNHEITEQADKTDVFMTAEEFFVQDKMFPLTFHFRMTVIPDEIDITQHPHNYGDDVVKVFIKIPVTFERYWDWCKALYKNIDAVEEFSEGTIHLAVPFIRK